MPGSEVSPIYGLTIWAGPQAAPWLIQNPIARVMEALGRGSVADRDLADAPATCADGAAYLIATGTTGGDPWEGQEGKLALAVGANAANGWIFIAIATEGQRLWVADEDLLIQYDGAAWVVVDVGASTLDALTDVNAPMPADGDVLTWDDVAGEWVPAAPAGGGGGDLLAANNLSDLADPATARDNLGVYSEAEADAAARAAIHSAPTTISGTAHTAVIGNAYGYLRFTNAAAVTFTIPPEASVAFAIGTVIAFEQAGAGVVTLDPDTGVIINSRAGALDTAGQFAVGQIKKIAADEWTAIGDLA